MRSGLAFALFFLLVCTAGAANFNPFAGPEPLLVFIQTNPWGDVIGSDTPRVAVYNDGELIFTAKVDKRLVYRTVKLDNRALESVRSHMQSLLSVKDLRSFYNVRPNVTDQPQAKFYLHDGERTATVSVYGLMTAGTKLPAYTKFPGGPVPTMPPNELLSLHQWLSELSYPDGKEWVPRFVEVILWDYSYAPDASIKWPSEWPSLSSERTLKRGSAYSIFLDGTALPELRAFLAKREPRGAVEIEGKKMAASYRFTFPNEPQWRKAFEAAK